MPWATAVPDGAVPTLTRVHPTAVYEALAAFVLAALLWRLQARWQPLAVIATYLVISGGARFLIETIRTNRAVLFGLTQPQLWSLVLMAAGAVVFLCSRRASTDSAPLRPDQPPTLVR